jgi:hypothetical protein
MKKERQHTASWAKEFKNFFEKGKQKTVKVE